MGKNTDTIEINGKRYDVRTGAALDGFDLGASNAVPVTVSVEPARQVPAVSSSSENRPHQVHRSAAKHQAAHRPQHAKTLRRDTVAKPAAGPKRRLKAHSHTDALLTKPTTAVPPKSSAHTVNEHRLRRADRTAKSASVKRFQALRPNASLIPVTVHKPPRPVAHSQPPRQRSAPRPAAVKRPHTTADLLEHALQQATSHLQPPPARRFSRRKTSLAAATLATVILVGFIAAQNLTNVQLRIASSKAGFAATLPDEAPAGYRLSHLNYSPGVVSAHYRSNSDGRAYAITEKVSQWDSNTLREEFLASNGHNYQTVESGGRTLYLYGKNAATWVSGGVWYHVQSNGSLSSDQLVRLATSL